MPSTDRVALLVDPDLKVARQVTEWLEPLDCEMLIIGSISAALEELELRKSPVQVALVERQIGRTNGLELVARLVVNQGCAVAVLDRESSILYHFMAIQLGAWEYLPKPLEEDEVLQAVTELFLRLDQGQTPRPVLGPGVEPLNDILHHVEQEALTGVLNLERPGKVARMLFSFGEVQSAEHGSQRGHDALTAMARHGDWTSSFKEESDDTDADSKRPAFNDALTRPAFYGPPTLGPPSSLDPHEIPTRQMDLPPEEVAGTVVDRNHAFRRMAAPLDEETSAPLDESDTAVLEAEATREYNEGYEEAITERKTRDAGEGPYDELKVIFTEETPEPKKPGDGVK
jgi:ActR/RegA family two-component response regulator